MPAIEPVYPEGHPPITVIVPVYRNIDMTLACIRSAMPDLQATQGARLLVVNDASPDEGMAEALEHVAAEWPDTITVLHNEKNLGFVATVNRGMRHCEPDDVVLLNSDVVLPSLWLGRLRDDAYIDATVATVTPLSNNTTICTFPDFLQDNPLAFGLDTEQIDLAFRDERLPCVEAPTGVGFCMYIKRSALKQVGLFDEERFGRGYGEENDFCQRAIAAGLRNIISPNLFAFHQGGVSFGDEKNDLIANATRVIGELHPRYHADVADFIAQDPLQRARVHRLFRLIAMSSMPRILHVSHGIGGGVDQHIFELAHSLSRQAIPLILSPSRDGSSLLLRLNATRHADAVVFRATDKHKLLRTLRALGVSMVHYHHTMNMPADYLALGQDLGVPHVLTVHDFYLLNSCPTLADTSGVYRGGDHDALINPLYPRPKGLSAQAWRDQYRGLVESAERVLFPTQATRDLFADAFNLQNALVVNHVEQVRNVHTPFKGLERKSRYTVAAIGALGVEKGAELFDAAARLAKKQNKTLDFVLIGYSHVQLHNVHTTGPYDAAQLQALLKKYGVDIILFPVRLPETYSYTLSYALESGCAIVAPRLGAFPERLAGRQGAALFNHLAPTAQVLDVIERLIRDCTEGIIPVVPGQPSTCTGDFYDTAYRQIALAVPAEPDPHFVTDDLVLASVTNEEDGRLFGLIWKLYRHPAMAWVDYVVPYRVRRWVKRSLTKKPLHNTAP